MEENNAAQKQFCLVLTAFGPGPNYECIKEQCVCCWDKTNKQCLVNEALYAFFVKTNWELMLDVSTKLDSQGRRIPRAEGDLNTLKDIFEKFKGVFGA